MADFLPEFERVLIAEGGYKLTDIANDKGGQTYAGISRKHNPSWIGWDAIDAGSTPTSNVVREFYKQNYWNPIRGDEIKQQSVAGVIYDFAVNAGVGTAVKLAQIVVGCTPDGKVGPKTLEAWNSIDEHTFRLAYCVAKVTRYRDIVARDKTQIKFLMGWLNRSLKSV